MTMTGRFFWYYRAFKSANSRQRMRGESAAAMQKPIVEFFVLYPFAAYLISLPIYYLLDLDEYVSSGLFAAPFFLLNALYLLVSSVLDRREHGWAGCDRVVSAMAILQ